MDDALAPAVEKAVRGRRLPPDERREQIVVSAARLFAQHPYAQVSTVEIAGEAGIARGLLNHYFGDKRGLYLEVVRRSVLLPTLEILPTDLTGTTSERVEIAVAWFLDSFGTQAASYVRVFESAGVLHDEEVAAIVGEADDLAARRVLQVVGLDEHDDLARAQVRCYGGMAKAVLHEWGRHGSLTREQAHALLRDTLLFLVADILS